MTLIKRYNNRKPEAIHMFDSFFGKDFCWNPEHFFNRIEGKPAVNIIESDNEYCIEVAAPGFEKEEFNIELSDYEIIEEKELTGELLSEKIKHYLDHPEALDGMAARARRYGKPEAAKNIVDDCYRLLTA